VTGFENDGEAPVVDRFCDTFPDWHSVIDEAREANPGSNGKCRSSVGVGRRAASHI